MKKWGSRQRRHIRATGIRHIGKEANELERQAMIGADCVLDPDYGLAGESCERLMGEIAALGEMLGNGEAAKALRISPRRLRAILTCKTGPDEVTTRALLTRLPAAIAMAEKLRAECDGELQRLHHMVQDLGLRGAARQLGIDPSNLRRKMSQARLQNPV